MTNYGEKEVEALASMLIEQLNRETVDKFVEDEHGDLVRIETYSLYEVAKSLYKSGCRVLSGNGKPRILAHKILSDETLLGMKKTDLIEYIRVLEHNWAATEQSLDQQAKYMEAVFADKENAVREMAKAIKPVMPYEGCGKDMRCKFKAENDIDCPECSIANALYEAGYRKDC